MINFFKKSSRQVQETPHRKETCWKNESEFFSCFLTNDRIYSQFVDSWNLNMMANGDVWIDLENEGVWEEIQFSGEILTFMVFQGLTLALGLTGLMNRQDAEGWRKALSPCRGLSLSPYSRAPSSCTARRGHWVDSSFHLRQSVDYTISGWLGALWTS